MREIVFDTETTGLNPLDGDRLVEIGCVELVNRIATGQTFHAYFNPGRSMPAEAQAVHGLSDAFLADKPSFHDRCDELLAFVAGSPLVAHNAGFDFAFLNHELGRCGKPIVCMSRMVDTLALARRRHPGAKHSLDALCVRFGVDRSLRVKHGALIDAQLLAEVYIELTGGRQIGLSLDPFVSKDEARPSGTQPLPAAIVVRPPRPHRPSEMELARHTAFVAKLVDPIWATLTGHD